LIRWSPYDDAHDGTDPTVGSGWREWGSLRQLTAV